MSTASAFHFWFAFEAVWSQSQIWICDGLVHPY